MINSTLVCTVLSKNTLTWYKNILLPISVPLRYTCTLYHFVPTLILFYYSIIEVKEHFFDWHYTHIHTMYLLPKLLSFVDTVCFKKYPKKNIHVFTDKVHLQLFNQATGFSLRKCEVGTSYMYVFEQGNKFEYINKAWMQAKNLKHTCKSAECFASTTMYASNKPTASPLLMASCFCTDSSCFFKFSSCMRRCNKMTSTYW